jgi:hypothetical protein
VQQRHDSLRASFAGFDFETPVQVVPRHANLAWHEVDLSNSEDASAAFAALVVADKTTLFDFDRASLVRFTLAACPGGETRFLWTYHHVVLDGCSVGVLWIDVLLAYEALREGRTPTLPPAARLDILATWRREQELVRPAAMSYWRGVVGDVVERTRLHAERPTAGRPGMPPLAVQRTIAETSTQRLVEAARSCRVTLVFCPINS